MTTGPALKPRARSVAISRVRAATAEYIVFTAPKTAPRSIKYANPRAKNFGTSQRQRWR